MTNKLYRIIQIFKEKPNFTIDDTIAEFEGRPDVGLYIPEVNYDKLSEAYNIPSNDFREKVANLTNPKVLENYNGEYLNLNWVTSIDVLAYRENLISGIFPLAIMGVVITKDNQILLGIRGGEISPERVEKFASGLYGLPPGGSVIFKEDYEKGPLEDTIKEEFIEELGNFNITSYELLGVFEAFTPGPIGIKLVSTLTTDATLEQIQKINRDANKLYESLLEKGASNKEAGKELKDRGLPPDAWEHPAIFGVYNDPNIIKYILKSQPQSFSGIGAGGLILYLNYLELQA